MTHLVIRTVGHWPVFEMASFRLKLKKVTVSAMMLGGGPTEGNSRATPLHNIKYKNEANR